MFTVTRTHLAVHSAILYEKLEQLEEAERKEGAEPIKLDLEESSDVVNCIVQYMQGSLAPFDLGHYKLSTRPTSIRCVQIVRAPLCPLQG